MIASNEELVYGFETVIDQAQHGALRSFELQINWYPQTFVNCRGNVTRHNGPVLGGAGNRVGGPHNLATLDSATRHHHSPALRANGPYRPQG